MASTSSSNAGADPDFADAQWHAPSGEIDGRRVELARVGETIALRDSACPDGPYLVFDSSEWQAFLAGVELGEFDTTGLVDGPRPEGPRGSQARERNSRRSGAG